MDSAEASVGRLLLFEFMDEAPAPGAKKGWPFASRFLRRGVMGTLLGGFYFDQQLSLWHNTLHLYIFMALCLVPFACTMVFGTDYIGFGLYVLFTALTIVPSKIINHWLHTHLDPPPRPAAPAPAATAATDAVPAPTTAASTLSPPSATGIPRSTSVPSRSSLASMSGRVHRGAGVLDFDEVDLAELNLPVAAPAAGRGVMHSFIDENGEVQHYVIDESPDEASEAALASSANDEVAEAALAAAAAEAAEAAAAAASSSSSTAGAIAEHASSSSDEAIDPVALVPSPPPSTSGTPVPPAASASTADEPTSATSAPAVADATSAATEAQPSPPQPEQQPPQASSNKKKDKKKKGDKADKAPSKPFSQLFHEWVAAVNLKTRRLFPDVIHRADLEGLLDRSMSWGEVAASLFFTWAVTLLGYQIFNYYDFTAPKFFFAIVLATAHFSLLKSPQPDAGSPLHDNKLTSYTRGLYVVIVAAAILILNAFAGLATSQVTHNFYGVTFAFAPILNVIVQVLLVVIIVLPIFHILAMLPQVNTLVNHVLEQFLMYVVGTTATQNITGGVFELVKSLVLILPAFFACVGAFSSSSASGSSGDPELSKVFALFAGLLLSYAYFAAATERWQLHDWPVLFARVKEALKKDGSFTKLIEEKTHPSPGWLLYDSIASIAILIIVFLLHLSPVFAYFETLAVFSALAVFLSFCTQYLIPQLRRPHPFGVLTKSILRAAEYKRYEVSARTQETWFERVVIVLQRLQSFLLYPVVVLCMMSASADYLCARLGIWWGALVLTVAAGKLARLSFYDLPTISWSVFLGFMFSYFELAEMNESIVLSTYIISAIVPKAKEIFLKTNFYLTYTAPWNVLWGSSFHVAIHPLVFPHVVLIFFQILVSSLISAPFYPLGGSPAFLMSYMRPVRFWERHYKTNRLKDDNQRLADALDQNTASNLNNLNSIFYEHLTKTLSETLYDDIQCGRYGGDIENGDMFIFVSDKLTAVMHLIQLGNGFVTFQIRGLEFKGTYCQERELEAITEDPEDNDLVVFNCGGLMPDMFKPRTWWGLRWRTWEILNQYTVLQTYSISLNPAANMFYAFSMRKVLVKFMIQSMLYHLIESPNLETWLSSQELLEPLMTLPANFVARDYTLSSAYNVDYDSKRGGISISSFQKAFGPWIKTCVRFRKRSIRKQLKIDKTSVSTGSFSVEDPAADGARTPQEADKDADKLDYFLSSSDPRTVTFAPRLLRLCFGLSLVARRSLFANSGGIGSSGDALLYMFSQLFRGDIRVTAVQDEWIYGDVSLLEIIKRSVRMTLKLYQDYVALSDEYNDPDELHGIIEEYSKTIVICSEGEAEWTNAVMADRPSLLSIRKAVNEKNHNEEHYVVMLNMKFSKFRTIKVNRESVRGMWAAQQLELIFFGNENSERGSIQQMKPAIRNLITQACDLPVGYPIFISPLTSSYTQAPSPLNVSWWKQELVKRIFK